MQKSKIGDPRIHANTISDWTSAKKKGMFRFSRQATPVAIFYIDPWFNVTKAHFIPLHVMHIVMHILSGDLTSGASNA